MSDETIVARILAGDYIIAQEFQDLADKVLSFPGVGEQILKSRSESERLKIIEGDFLEEPFSQMLNEAYDVLTKNESLAKLIKESGDKSLKQSNLSLAIRSYNLAALFIPEKSESIRALFAQRATALLQSGKIAECLFDIETANSFAMSQELKTSLVEMKLKCLELKSDTDNAEEEHKQDIRDYCNDVMFNIAEHPNSKLQSGTEFIKVVCSKEKGRHVVVTKDLEPGVPLIVETPYVKVLDGVCQWDMKRCCHCFKDITAGVRCPECVFNIYCSETCRMEDFYNGHQFECSSMPFMHSIQVPPTIHVCLKVICKAGPNIFLGMYENSKAKAVENETNEIQGFDPETGMYNSDSYYQVRNLISHDYFHGAPAITIPLLALTFVRTLEIKTQFFSGIAASEKSDFMSFVANELIFLCHSVPFNTFGLFEHSGLMPDATSGKKLNAMKIKRVEIGRGIYSLASLMNSSCDPTVFRSNLKNGTMAIVTNRKMKAGDEVTVTYGFRFMKEELSDRQSKIKENYRFECDCVACHFEWPIQKNMTTNLEFICPECCGTFDYRNSDEAKKRTLKPCKIGGLCKFCGKEFLMRNLRLEAFAMQDKLTEAHKFGNTGRMLEAIPLLIECIGFYQTRMLYPNSAFLSAQEQLRKCHLLIVDACKDQTTKN